MNDKWLMKFDKMKITYVFISYNKNDFHDWFRCSHFYVPNFSHAFGLICTMKCFLANNKEYKKNFYALTKR